MIAIYQYLRLSAQSLIHTKAADARCSWGRKLGRDRHLAPGRPRQSWVLHELDHGRAAPSASRLPRRMRTGSGPGIGAFSLSVDRADDLAGSADDPFRHRARVEPGSCFGDFPLVRVRRRMRDCLGARERGEGLVRPGGTDPRDVLSASWGGRDPSVIVAVLPVRRRSSGPVSRREVNDLRVQIFHWLIRTSFWNGGGSTSITVRNKTPVKARSSRSPSADRSQTSTCSL